MPRYHFHVSNGVAQSDLDGVDMPNLHAAKLEAQRFAGEFIRDAASRDECGDALRVEVADESGRALFLLDFTTSVVPADLARD